MKKNREEYNQFLKTLTYGTEYRILEAGKDDEELQEVAKSHKLKLPARDISIFKGIFAFVDEQNKNGCTLPKEEVAKALNTIGGKAVDFDHYRKRVVGHWLEGKLVGDKIISYGIFNKGNFPEDFATITDLMNNGNLKISMEAWGNRVFTNEAKTEYILEDIEFSGGALLIDTKPAFAGAEVLELAKVMTAPEKFVKDEEDKKQMEISRMYTFDMDTILRLLWETVCPGCGEMYSTVDAIDFKHNMVKSHCEGCDTDYVISLTPKTYEIPREEARKIVKIEKDASAKSEVIQSKTEEVNNMDELKKQLEEAMAKITTLTSEVETVKTEGATLKKSLEEANAKVAELTAKLEKAETEKSEAVELAKKNATLIANRRSELGEYAKDISDEDLLDDRNYKIAKLEKENASLKAATTTTEVAAVKKEEKTETKLEVGSKTDKEGDGFKRAKVVRELAYGKQS